MARQFIKVGTMVFNRDAINAVSIEDTYGFIHVFTSDCNGDPETRGYPLDLNEPETQAFIMWLTDPERCLDVMTIEPAQDVPRVIETPSGIRFEV